MIRRLKTIEEMRREFAEGRVKITIISPVVRCPCCGITVFTGSDAKSELCNACKRQLS